MEKTKTRNFSLDLIRIIAVIAVILLHACADFANEFNIQGIGRIIADVINCIVRPAVPLFIMISGALFLDDRKTVSIQDVLHKYTKNIFLIIVVWSTIYCLIDGVLLEGISDGFVSLNIKDIITSFLLGHYHMWYLYMLIGLYLITPFLKSIINEGNDKNVLCFIGISLFAQFSIPVISAIANIFPDAEIILQLIEKFNLQFFGGYTAYYLAGWYIVHRGIKSKKCQLALLLVGIVSLLVTVIYINTTHDYSNGFSRFNVFIFLYSICLFYFLYKIRIEQKQKSSQIIFKLSTLSFGIYIIHPIVRAAYKIIFPFHKYVLVYIIVQTIVVFVLSGLCCFIISKIPVIKKLIRF